MSSREWSLVCLVVTLVTMGSGCEKISPVDAQDTSSFVSWEEFVKRPGVLGKDLSAGQRGEDCLVGKAPLEAPSPGQRITPPCQYDARQEGAYSIERAAFDRSGEPFALTLSFHPKVSVDTLPGVLDASAPWPEAERFTRRLGKTEKAYAKWVLPEAKKGELLHVLAPLDKGFIKRASVHLNPFEERELTRQMRRQLGEPLVAKEELGALSFSPALEESGTYDVVVRLSPSMSSVNGVEVNMVGHIQERKPRLRVALERALEQRQKEARVLGRQRTRRALISPRHDTPWRDVSLAQHILSESIDGDFERVDLGVTRAPSLERVLEEGRVALLPTARDDIGWLETFRKGGGALAVHLLPRAVYFEFSSELPTASLGVKPGARFLRYDPEACGALQAFDALVCLKSASKVEESASAPASSVSFDGHREALRGYALHRLSEATRHIMEAMSEQSAGRPDKVAVRADASLSAQVVLSLIDVLQGNVQDSSKGERLCDGVLAEGVEPLTWRSCAAPAHVQTIYFATGR